MIWGQIYAACCRLPTDVAHAGWEEWEDAVPDGVIHQQAVEQDDRRAVYIQILPMLLDEHADLATGIEAAFATAADDIANTGWANMCPVGTVTGEIADSEPDLREVAAEVIASWVEAGTRYMAGRGLSEPDARALTYAVLSSLEGAFILARGQRSAEPLLAAGRALAAYVATLPVTSSAG